MVRAGRSRADSPTRDEALILFPAIDLKDGQCVRLKLGEMDAVTVFSDDPAAQARTFEEQGFQWLHVVDLNGAFAGKPVNADAVEAIQSVTDGRGLPRKLYHSSVNAKRDGRWAVEG